MALRPEHRSIRPSRDQVTASGSPARPTSGQVGSASRPFEQLFGRYEAIGVPPVHTITQESFVLQRFSGAHSLVQVLRLRLWNGDAGRAGDRGGEDQQVQGGEEVRVR